MKNLGYLLISIVIIGLIFLLLKYNYPQRIGLIGGVIGFSVFSFKLFLKISRNKIKNWG